MRDWKCCPRASRISRTAATPRVLDINPDSPIPTFTCDLTQQGTPFTHSWEYIVGSDHAPIALRADWQDQLRRCREELGFRYVRFHGLLSDDMGTLIGHRDQLLYSFFNADRILDFLLSIGMRPFVELSFMPSIIASGSDTVFRYKGNVTPPRDYGQWATLMASIATSIEKGSKSIACSAMPDLHRL